MRLNIKLDNKDSKKRQNFEINQFRWLLGGTINVMFTPVIISIIGPGLVLSYYSNDYAEPQLMLWFQKDIKYVYHFPEKWDFGGC